jgi:hypothetical protein
MISSLPDEVLTSHAHPDPNSVAAAFENWSLNPSKEPKLSTIASSTVPVGAPPAFGARQFQ